MRVGILQSQPPFLDQARATKEAVSALQEMSQEGADLVIFPELANSGYAFHSQEDAQSQSETADGTGPFLSTLLQASVQLELSIVAGFCESDGDALFNSSALIDAGVIKSVYRKVHLFDREKEWFQAGSQLPEIHQIKGLNLAMLICFDWMFPEMWRAVGLAGADLVAHPANLVLPWAQKGVVGHALCNRMFIATANRVGNEEGLHFTGQSQIINPKGEAMLSLSESTVEWGIVDCDPALARNKDITKRCTLFQDRKPDVYSQHSGLGPS